LPGALFHFIQKHFRSRRLAPRHLRVVQSGNDRRLLNVTGNVPHRRQDAAVLKLLKVMNVHVPTVGQSFRVSRSPERSD
jgi:hypothetical protein